jgi:5-methylthioadenosine/S-adenosylhomocysteine deaminase
VIAEGGTPGARVAWHARWVFTGADPLRHDAAVVVAGAQIVWVGPSAEAEADRHERLGDCLLMPGLVNAHTHLELTTLRGFLEGLPFREWLRTLTVVRRDVLSDDDLRDAARLGVSEALRAGITCLADCSASGAPLDAMIEAGVRGRVYLETFGPDPAQVPASMQALRDGVERLRARTTALVDVGVSPHAPYTVSAPLYEAVARYALDEELAVATHVAESAAECEFVRSGEGPFAEALLARGIRVRGTGDSPLALLERTALLATEPLLIHAIHLGDADLERIARHRATVVHCPISNAKLGQGIAGVAHLRSRGVPVALGTDSVASNDAMDLVQEARQAVLLASLKAGRPDALTALEALTMATVEGARALRLFSRSVGPPLGVLSPGAAADLAAFTLDADEVTPVYDPCVALVHVAGGARRAALTMVAGRVLVRDGIVLGEDPDVRGRVEAAAARVRAWADTA